MEIYGQHDHVPKEMYIKMHGMKMLFMEMYGKCIIF